MDKRLMKRWVKALRSGKYEQGKHQLKTEDGKYCCLGVLCEVEGLLYSKNKALYHGESLKTEVGLLPKSYKVGNHRIRTLSELNDLGLSFKQIANIIEKNYKDL